MAAMYDSVPPTPPPPKDAWTPLTIVFTMIFLVGSLFYSLGPAITQWALKRERRCLATFGMVLFTIGGILWNTGAQRMPSLLAAPLLTVVLLFNVIFAKLLNGEGPSMYDLLGNCFIGCYVILLVFGQPEETPFHCRFVTHTCVPDFHTDNTCKKQEMDIHFLEHEIVLAPAFLAYVGLSVVAILILGLGNLYIQNVQSPRQQLNDLSMDFYRLSYSTIGGVLGGAQDILIFLFVAQATALVEGCTEVFLHSWLLYAVILCLFVAFPAQIWGVARGTTIAGAKLSVTLELMSHQFATLAGLTLGFRGYTDFDKNIMNLPWQAAVGIFAVTICFGLAGATVTMRGYSFRARHARYCLGRQGSIHTLAAASDNDRDSTPAMGSSRLASHRLSKHSGGATPMLKDVRSWKTLDLASWRSLGPARASHSTGMYGICWDGLYVSAGISTSSERIGILAFGDKVRVVEIGSCDGCVRGLLEEPSGWISISAFHGVYAVPDADPELPEATASHHQDELSLGALKA